MGQQMMPCTKKKKKKNIYIYICTNKYIPTNKNGNHEPISFYMTGTLWDGMFSYLYYFQSTNSILGLYLLFWSFYPLTLCLHIYQKGDDVKVGTRLVLFTISA